MLAAVAATLLLYRLLEPSTATRGPGMPPATAWRSRSGSECTSTWRSCCSRTPPSCAGRQPRLALDGARPPAWRSACAMGRHRQPDAGPPWPRARLPARPAGDVGAALLGGTRPCPNPASCCWSPSCSPAPGSCAAVATSWPPRPLSPSPSCCCGSWCNRATRIPGSSSGRHRRSRLARGGRRRPLALAGAAGGGRIAAGAASERRQLRQGGLDLPRCRRLRRHGRRVRRQGVHAANRRHAAATDAWLHQQLRRGDGRDLARCDLVAYPTSSGRGSLLLKAVRNRSTFPVQIRLPGAVPGFVAARRPVIPSWSCHRQPSRPTRRLVRAVADAQRELGEAVGPGAEPSTASTHVAHSRMGGPLTLQEADPGLVS